MGLWLRRTLVLSDTLFGFEISVYKYLYSFIALNTVGWRQLRVGCKLILHLMINKTELQKLAKNYLSARKDFLSAIRQDHPELGGNDNIVGRIGEYIALQFLIGKGRTVSKCRSATNKGYDIICSSGRQISVKTITAESKTGRSTTLKQPWQELIMIYIGKDYEVEKIGHMHVENFNVAVDEDFIKINAVADRKYFLDGGLFSKYGNLYSGEEVSNFL
jgi:hypothetical protein